MCGRVVHQLMYSSNRCGLNDRKAQIRVVFVFRQRGSGAHETIFGISPKQETEFCLTSEVKYTIFTHSNRSICSFSLLSNPNLGFHLQGSIITARNWYYLISYIFA
ncbi:hypothetical protein FRX31_026168 [Thalictrum thalictroides]|uniref:Uncharacterized protein n=1 Tax=Thalictrum thalictroides TaxID=46969 RepID=A0A7J6VIV6_THATH|nr:hypothetical protein FRX31_026168 [Thalictrum thalictroides]